MRLLKKLFYSPNYFTIAIRKKKNAQDSLMHTHLFNSETEIKSKTSYWKADPLLIEKEGKTYLFYEAVYKGKGVIEAAEIFDDCSIGESKIILESESHLSYPFVFQYDERWYLIPESSAEKKIKLYEAVLFPYEWKCIQTLLADIRAVDTTILNRDNRLYLVTFEVNGLNERVIPRAYMMEKKERERFSLTPMPWQKYDELRCRGAGGFFGENNRIYRPSQINEETQYGNGIAINEVQSIDGIYDEHEVASIMPSQVTFKRYPHDGLHTYTATEHFEAIDVRCAFFDLLKPFKIIKRLVKNVKTN